MPFDDDDVELARVIDLSDDARKAAKDLYRALRDMDHHRRRSEIHSQRLAKEQQLYCEAKAAAHDALRSLATAPLRLQRPNRIFSTVH